MAQVDTGTLICRVLKEQGVKVLFGLYGGHVIPIVRRLEEHGIRFIHVRHEQTAAYAADAWARSTGTPGLCLVTAGCGLTNALTGLALAASAQSAVVCLSGQHPTCEDNMGSFQEVYGSEIMGSFAKAAKRVIDWTTIGYDLRQAFRAAVHPPQGVSLLEIPVNIMQAQGEEEKQARGGKIYDLDEIRFQGDPRQVERAVELLHRAKRPLIVAGDGVFWSGGALEIKELAELSGTPVLCRRAGRGALDEAHRLSVRGVWSKPFTGNADVVVAVGFKFWSGENFGRPPKWTDEATIVQIDSTADQVGSHVPADVALVGDPKSVLRQMIDTIGRMGLDFSAKLKSPWVEHLKETRQRHDKAVRERAQKNASAVPVHPDRIMRDLLAVLDENAVIVKDSFTMSGYVDQWFTPRAMGRVIDAGPLAPVGAGVGMGLGAQLANPGKQVVVMSGDGGIGIGGMDLETAARCKIPILVVLFNNSSWGPDPAITFRMQELRGTFRMLPKIRYDKVFEPLGVHTEHVEEPDELVPALERSLSSGAPSLVNVVSDDRYAHPTLGEDFFSQTRF